MTRLLAGAMFLVMMLDGGHARAQAQPNLRGQPAFGTLSLEAGFLPDPRTVQVRAGGPTSAEPLGRGCTGYIDYRQPDVNLIYRAGNFPLFISVRSGADTTLVVNLPDGSWICNDDANGLDPAILLRRPQSGLYNIWVGTYEPGGLQPSVLSISEVPPR